MWWPDPAKQPLEQIARYDWVILGEWNSGLIGPLLKLHPDMLLLNSSNACEVSFDDQRIQEIPPEWYLTQEGTSLRSDEDATQTSLPVQALTASDGTQTFDLFVPGDTALIEGESVYVEGVDAASRTLTVRRGYIRPAAAHTAGRRIAAHISFWPNSWMLNVSTLSPAGIASPAVGPETWASYLARFDARRLVDPRWAGLLVDRSDPDESWVIGNSTARTIDPDQSNRLLSDYRAFDAAWNAGLRSYLQGLRERIGPEKIIYLNWGIPAYELVNGNNFEDFPRDDGSSYSSDWQTTVFGPWAGSGSYFEWLANARQPNLTMIETYEDDSSPDPSDTNGYPRRCDNPDFVPNYRKMRFGLASALLNDGYFSYEMNTEGHGSLCLMWFDEYDNAGSGGGYLGYPLEAASRIALQAGVYRREFDGGIVLVNASDKPVNLPLGGSFQKIDGRQDRSVNDGSLVSEVTLPPLDGIILLRP